MKNRLYMTTSDELCGWMEKRLQSTSQSQTCSRKGSWSLFGGLLPVWSTTAFWIPAKPWHLRSMLSKPVRHIENCNACSQHQPTERARVLSMRMPDCTLHSQHFKSWTNWATKFCLIHNIHLNSYQQTNTSSVSTTFAVKALLQTAGGRKCFQESVESWSTDFYSTGINQLIFLLV